MTWWSGKPTRIVQQVRTHWQTGAGWLHRYVVAAKPYADVLLPLSLVFFAYKANEVSRQQAEIQRTQADLQKLQTQPVFRVMFDDDGPSTAHEHAQVQVQNYGGPAFDWSIETAPAFELQAADRSDAIPYTKMFFLEDYGYSTYYKVRFPIKLSNMDRESQSSQVMPIKWDLQKIDSFADMLKTIKIKDYSATTIPIIVLIIKWRNYAGIYGERKYLIFPSYIMQVEKLPERDVVKLNMEELRAAFDRTIKEAHYTLDLN